MINESDDLWNIIVEKKNSLQDIIQLIQMCQRLEKKKKTNIKAMFSFYRTPIKATLNQNKTTTQ